MNRRPTIALMLVFAFAPLASAQPVLLPPAAQIGPPAVFPDTPIPPPGPNIAPIPGAFDIGIPSDRCLTSVVTGVRSWMSWAQTSHSFGGGIDGLGLVNPLSELKWRSVTSQTVEFNASTRWFERFIVNAEVGFGGVNGGNLTDLDFGQNNRQNLLFQSKSPIAGDGVSYFNVDLGWRIYETAGFALDGLLGYQFVREKYVAEGGDQTDYLAGTTIALPAGPGITEQFTWQGLRVGGQTILEILPGWAIKSRVMFMPMTFFELRDIHHNRADLRQNPTGSARTSGGFGVFAEMLLSYHVWRGFYADIGYRVWSLESSSGSLHTFGVIRDFDSPFNGASILRQGVVVALSYHF